MQNTHPLSVALYIEENGKNPFLQWLQKLHDAPTKARIQRRIELLQEGNVGDCKALGGGLYELRLFFGKGYRVYYGQREQRAVLLLCGGDKDSQDRDIAQARIYWSDYLRRTTQ